MGIITTNLLNRFWKRGIKPIKESLDGKFDASGVIESVNITEPGFVMDGKTASEAFAELNRKFVVLSIPFTITEKVSGARGYDEIAIPENRIPDEYIPEMWCFQTGDISNLTGIQITICSVNRSKLWYEYYCPNSVKTSLCHVRVLCRKV